LNLQYNKAMLKYLVILLSDDAVSYCHYDSSSQKSLMSLDDLKESIFYAMKENLSIQYILPEQRVPEDYQNVMRDMPGYLVSSATGEMVEFADVIVHNEIETFEADTFDGDAARILRITKDSLYDSLDVIKDKLHFGKKISIVLTDINKFKEQDFVKYHRVMNDLVDATLECLKKGINVQLNTITDRLVLTEMNNCNAGVECITVAPNGKFYLCPAFYYESQDNSVGDPQNGLEIKNSQLLKLQYAPLCRRCDAYQCRRCVWLNRYTTLELNTPSHEQCVVSHIERNASRDLMQKAREVGNFLPGRQIPEIDYLDPFDVREEL